MLFYYGWKFFNFTWSRFLLRSCGASWLWFLYIPHCRCTLTNNWWHRHYSISFHLGVRVIIVKFQLFITTLFYSCMLSWYLRTLYYWGMITIAVWYLWFTSIKIHPLILPRLLFKIRYQIIYPKVLFRIVFEVLIVVIFNRLTTFWIHFWLN